MTYDIYVIFWQTKSINPDIWHVPECLIPSRLQIPHHHWRTGHTFLTLWQATFPYYLTVHRSIVIWHYPGLLYSRPYNSFRLADHMSIILWQTLGPLSRTYHMYLFPWLVPCLLLSNQFQVPYPFTFPISSKGAPHPLHQEMLHIPYIILASMHLIPEQNIDPLFFDKPQTPWPQTLYPFTDDMFPILWQTTDPIPLAGSRSNIRWYIRGPLCYDDIIKCL